MFIDLSTSSKRLIIEVFPSVKYETHCELMDFPDVSYNSDVQPIFHIVKVVTSLEFIHDQYEITDEIEKNMKERYWVDEEKDQLIIAKMVMTEFPDFWRERMEVNWSHWLDAIDGDHFVIGLRADEILDRELYDNPFDLGSLFYIREISVHDSFKNNNIEKNYYVIHLVILFNILLE